jgi:HAD superfamily hydrolase (TIGR01459 family)
MARASRPSDTTTDASSTSIRILEGVRDLLVDYDIFLLDMWGVMHDGTTTYEGVLDVIQKLKQAGKDLVILSNSSKRQDNSIRMLRKLGFDSNDFSSIITSGEVSYHLLSQSTPDSTPLAPQSWALLDSIVGNPDNRKVFCFGSGDGDEEYLASCGWTLADINDANLIVARGTFVINDGTTVTDKTLDGDEAYQTRFEQAIRQAAERRIPMIVANPDKIRPDADRSPMPGGIGDAYEHALGDDDKTGLVKRIGKPFEDVYEIALRNKDRSKACMIGDSLETDVTGGSAEGIATIWVVNDGIHYDDVLAKGEGSLSNGCTAVLEDFNKLEGTYAKGRQLSPTFVLPHFRW